MKLGILTFHSAINYGAVLQAYALQEKCKEYAEEVCIVDYRPQYIESNYKFIPIYTDINGKRYFRISQLKKLINNIYNLKGFSLKKQKINRFLNQKLNLSEDIKEVYFNDFDYLICGSDQIWNPEIARGLDQHYFGIVNGEKALKCIAYAASIGKKDINSKYIEEFKRLLNNVDYISVREKNSIPQLRKLTMKKMMNVLDPTLLVNKNTWNKFILKNDVKEKYLLIYRMENNPNIDIIAKKVAKHLNLKIIEIGSKNLRYRIEHELKNDIGIEEFLTYFYNAEFVLTNSFHGTAFSIVFNKNFYSILHSTLGLRIKDLLEDIGLSNRIINNEDIDLNELLKIDWKNANMELERLKRESESFLMESIDSMGVL